MHGRNRTISRRMSSGVGQSGEAAALEKSLRSDAEAARLPERPGNVLEFPVLRFGFGADFPQRLQLGGVRSAAVRAVSVCVHGRVCSPLPCASTSPPANGWQSQFRHTPHPGHAPGFLLPTPDRRLPGRQGSGVRERETRDSASTSTTDHRPPTTDYRLPTTDHRPLFPVPRPLSPVPCHLSLVPVPCPSSLSLNSL